MEQEKKIIWSPLARNSFNEILDFNSLIEKVNEKVLNISKFNFMGKQSDISDLRVIYLNHYELFYQISNDVIFITLMWDARRNPEDLKNLLGK